MPVDVWNGSPPPLSGAATGSKTPKADAAASGQAWPGLANLPGAEALSPSLLRYAGTGMARWL